jgi:hypothetical protein
MLISLVLKDSPDGPYGSVQVVYSNGCGGKRLIQGLEVLPFEDGGDGILPFIEQQNGAVAE